MGRASKSRGPIGHNSGQGRCLPDSPGQRKAPCSLAPWQLPPKTSAAGDMPTCGNNQGKGASRRAAFVVRNRLQAPGKPVDDVRPARDPYDPAPALVR